MIIRWIKNIIQVTVDPLCVERLEMRVKLLADQQNDMFLVCQDEAENAKWWQKCAEYFKQKNPEFKDFEGKCYFAGISLATKVRNFDKLKIKKG